MEKSAKIDSMKIEEAKDLFDMKPLLTRNHLLRQKIKLLEEESNELRQQLTELIAKRSQEPVEFSMIGHKMAFAKVGQIVPSVDVINDHLPCEEPVPCEDSNSDSVEEKVEEEEEKMKMEKLMV